MYEKQVSVILVNYNNKDMAIDAVNSVFEKTLGMNFEVIVADDNSQDNSVQVMKDALGDKIRIVRSQKSLGWGGGCNLGIKNANGKYVLLLNLDTEFINNAIMILYDFMEANPQAGVCGGNLYNGDGKPTYSYSTTFLKDNQSALVNLFKSVKRKMTGRLSGFFNYSNKIKEVDCITGAGMMIRKEAMDKNNIFFDEDFFTYHAEPEFENRIKKAGYLCYSVPQAKIIHFEGKTFKGDRERRFRQYTFGSYLYYEKTYGKDAVKKHFNERKLFTKLVNLISLGFYRKECAMRQKVLKEEFAHWQKERG
jgi:GT2 family glycosyltransferase